jgi:hypothetical protein
LIRVLIVATQSQDVDITVTPTGAAEFAKDWDDSAGFTVTAYTSATRLLQLSANRPDSLDVGDGIIVEGHTGKELIVEKLGTNPDEVIIVEETYAPIAAEVVRSGGPLVEPCRLVILAHIDALGPREGDFADGSWDGTMYTNKLTGIVDDVDGVKTEIITTPAADVDAAAQPFPNDTTVNLLIPGEILVRYA